MSSPVENEMLEHKDGVEEDGRDAQDELDKVECTLLEKRLAKGNWVEDTLQQRQWTTCEIKKDILEWPSNGALSLVVEVDLGAVLDKGDGSLGIAHDEPGIPGVWEWVAEDLCHHDCNHNDVKDNKETNPVLVDLALLTSL